MCQDRKINTRQGALKETSCPKMESVANKSRVAAMSKRRKALGARIQDVVAVTTLPRLPVRGGVGGGGECFECECPLHSRTGDPRHLNRHPGKGNNDITEAGLTRFTKFKEIPSVRSLRRSFVRATTGSSPPRSHVVRVLTSSARVIGTPGATRPPPHRQLQGREISHKKPRFIPCPLAQSSPGARLLAFLVHGPLLLHALFLEGDLTSLPRHTRTFPLLAAPSKIQSRRLSR
jgi:hypothetical protein